MTVMVALGMPRLSREAMARPAAPAPAMTMRVWASDVCAAAPVIDIAAGTPAVRPASRAAPPPPARNPRLFILSSPPSRNVRSCVCGELAARPRRDLLRRHGAGCAGDLAAAGKKNHRRYAADAEAGGGVRLRIAIELHEPHPRLQLGGRGREGRRHRPARAAPGRPHVDQHRHVAVPYLAVEHGGVRLGGPAREQPRLAAAAARGLGRPVPRDAVDAGALRADDLATGGHKCATPRNRMAAPSTSGRSFHVDYIYVIM